MNLRPSSVILAVFAFAGLLGSATAALPRSDLVPPERRRAAVEQAARLANPAVLAPLPADLPQPFNPEGFAQPDPEEARSLAAAQALATAASAPSKPSGDRELLAHIVARIQPSGTLRFGEETLLIFGKKRLRPGDRITVTYDGQDYELELASVDQSTFTLRLNKEEYTRSVKPGKTP